MKKRIILKCGISIMLVLLVIMGYFTYYVKAENGRLRLPEKWYNTPKDAFIKCDFSTAEREAVRAAMQQWNKVRDTKGKSIVSLYLTTGATDSRVIYSNYSFPKIGYTEHILRGDEILGATIHLASTEKWSVGYSPGCYDIQTVVLHELGHMLGVAHCHEDGSEPPCFSKTCESNVMNPYVSPGKIKRTFQEYDTASYIIIYD